MKKLMTLAAALATGRPFKHKSWKAWASVDDKDNTTCGFHTKDFFAPVWQVQEEEKPPMRVWLSEFEGLVFSAESQDAGFEDVTESLAAALAPYIKKELGL